jgi:hypothetical protein
LISPTFYEQLLRQFSFNKKLQSQTVNRGKLCKTLSYKKDGHKMLVKLTPSANFIIVLRAAFTCADPESTKKTVKLSIFFCAFGICAYKSCI